jgi:hypothetical protein
MRRLGKDKNEMSETPTVETLDTLVRYVSQQVHDLHMEVQALRAEVQAALDAIAEPGGSEPS